MRYTNTVFGLLCLFAITILWVFSAVHGPVTMLIFTAELIVMVLLLPFFTLIHEGGHFLFGRLLKIKALVIRIGIGKPMTSFTVRDVKIELDRNIFAGGAVAFNWTPDNYTSTKHLIVSLGGIISSGTVLSLLLILGIFPNVDRFIGIYGFAFDQIVIFAALLLFISSLIPGSYQKNNNDQPNDMLSVLRIIFKPQTIRKEFLEWSDFYPLMEIYNKEGRDAAWKYYQSIKKEKTENKYFRLFEATIDFSDKNYKEAGAQFESLYKEKVFPHIESNLLHNIIYLHLALSDGNDDHFQKADVFSKIAFDRYNKSVILNKYRGAILIEKGRYAEGIPLMFTGFRFTPEDTNVISSIYLYFAYKKIGRSSEALKYRAFAEANRDKMKEENRMLFERFAKIIAF